MLYATSDKFGLTYNQARRLIPNISFSPDSVFVHSDVWSYVESPQPDYDSKTQRVIEIAPVDGVQQWVIIDRSAQEIRQELKTERDAKVAAIVVTTSTGKAFNGDETSQTRMARAIVGMQAASAATITWVLADNTAVEVTLAEFSEALVLAGKAQADIWVLPD